MVTRPGQNRSVLWPKARLWRFVCLPGPKLSAPRVSTALPARSVRARGVRWSLRAIRSGRASLGRDCVAMRCRPDQFRYQQRRAGAALLTRRPDVKLFRNCALVLGLMLSPVVAAQTSGSSGTSGTSGTTGSSSTSPTGTTSSGVSTYGTGTGRSSTSPYAGTSTSPSYGGTSTSPTYGGATGSPTYGGSTGTGTGSNPSSPNYNNPSTGTGTPGTTGSTGNTGATNPNLPPSGGR